MTLNKLYNKLVKAGYNVETGTLYNIGGTGENAEMIIVNHDYSGPYPTREALNTAENARNLAIKNNFHYQHRGNYQATFIYC